MSTSRLKLANMYASNMIDDVIKCIKKRTTPYHHDLLGPSAAGQVHPMHMSHQKHRAAHDEHSRCDIRPVDCHPTTWRRLLTRGTERHQTWSCSRHRSAHRYNITHIVTTWCMLLPRGAPQDPQQKQPRDGQAQTSRAGLVKFFHRHVTAGREAHSLIFSRVTWVGGAIGTLTRVTMPKVDIDPCHLKHGHKAQTSKTTRSVETNTRTDTHMEAEPAAKRVEKLLFAPGRIVFHCGCHSGGRRPLPPLHVQSISVLAHVAFNDCFRAYPSLLVATYPIEMAKRRGKQTHVCTWARGD